MVFENVEDIIKLLKLNDKPPKWVIDARLYHEELKQLVYGDDFKKLLLKIEHIESDKRAKAREKYSRSIQDLNERILRLIDNIYTATGGGKDYLFESETLQKELLKIVTHNRDNRSLESFLQTFWAKDLYIVDPSGILFLEYSTEKNITPHPTYKSIDRIRNYKAKGQNLDWIIFEPKIIKETKKILGFNAGEKEVKFVRFVDDKKDYTFKLTDNKNYELIEELTFEHPFGSVPGLVNSNIQRLGTEKRFSLIDNVMPLEREYLRDQSILTIYKFLNGFITPIRPAVVCSVCSGSGKITTTKERTKCTDCDGEGYMSRKDVTDEIIIPISLDKESGFNIPVGAFTYMSPPLEIWDQYIKEGDRFSNTIEDTLWGSHKQRFENERTAFETFIDTQPVAIKLSSISDVAEFMEWQFTEWIGNFVDPIKPKDKIISIISYGKMFIIEPVDALMEKYRINKDKGISVVILDRQLLEIITVKYRNNPEVLKAELTKKELDYYIHYTIKEVKETFDNKEAQKKMLFTDWWETIDFNIIKDKKIEVLKTDRDKWINNEISKLNIKQDE